MTECAVPNRINPLLCVMQQVEARMASLIGEARALFYQIMLFLKPCPVCGAPALNMIEDGQAQCAECGHDCDPTVAFQTCSNCDGNLVRRVYHYFCPACRLVVRSHYCFDEKIFDAQYFRERMAESRSRKREKTESIRAVFRDKRSSVFIPRECRSTKLPADLDTALNIVLGQPISINIRKDSESLFNMNHYRAHLLGLVAGCVVNFDGISPLISDSRIDRAFRFVAAVYLENDGLIQIDNDDDGCLLLVGA